MEGLDPAAVAALWGLGSAAAVAGVGVVSLSGGKARPRGAVAFALFATTWGIQILLGNAARIAPASWVEPLVLGLIAFSLPVGYFLVEFASTTSPDGGRGWRWLGLRFVAALCGLIAALCLILTPEFIYQGVQTYESGVATPIMGPLYTPLIVAPQFFAFGITLLVLARSVSTAPTPRMAQRSAMLLGGLGVYVSYAAGNNAAFYATSKWLYSGVHWSISFLAAVFACLAVIVISVATIALFRARNAHSARERRATLWLVASLLVPLALGAVEGIFTTLYAPAFESVGLWRLLGVGIIAYGLARWRLFDLPQRAAKTAATAAGASGSLATGVATYGLATLVTTSALVPAFLGLAVVGASFLPGIRMARKLFSRFTNEDGARDDVVYGQRVEAYRAALEASLARGNPEEDAEFLAALRERFGISEAEDRLLRYYARSAVLVPKQGDGGAAYERLRLLGEGGAGRTWLARDRVRDRLVVLKEPLGRWQREDAVRDMVLREARLAAKVRHPNVIAVEEVVEDKGLPVIVMEYVEGGSLADLLRERGVLPWREAVELTVQVLRGVEAVHQSGILHRDLKPSNVLLGADGTPKVADFGIATAIAPGGEGKTVVEGSTTFQGTIAYVAPEVRAGASGDRRADVYACGALLHECLHGSPPGPGMPVLASNEVPPRVAAAMARAIHPDANQRIPTARAFADELVAVMRP